MAKRVPTASANQFNFGGSELGCIVAEKVLDIVTAGPFTVGVEEVAKQFALGLGKLRERFPALLVDVRQMGLMMGLVFAHPLHGPFFTKAAYEAGLLSVYANNDKKVVQFLPPLICTDSEVAEIMKRFEKALKALKKLKYKAIKTAVRWI